MSDRKKLALPTEIVLTVVAAAFAVGSAYNPFGLISVTLSLLSAAMLCVLALSADRASRRLAVFIHAPAVFIISAYAFTYLGGYPLDEALLCSLNSLFASVLALPIVVTAAAGRGRTVSITASAITSLLFWAICIALRLSHDFGELSLAALESMIDEAFLPVREALESLTFEHDGSAIRYFGDEDIGAMLYTVKTLLIGIFAALLICISYLVTLATRLIAGCFELESRLPSSVRVRMRISRGDDGPTVEFSRDTVVWRIELDSISAFVLIGAYIFSLLFASSSGAASEPSLPIAATAQNLLLILTPGFVYAGVRDMMIGNIGAGGCIVFPLAAILAFINPLTLAVLLSAVGISAVLRENRTRERIERFAENRRGSDSDDKSNDKQ